MRLRYALARWLSPELARAADKGWWLQLHLQETKWWVGHEFPVVEVVVDRLATGMANHFRALDDPAVTHEHPRMGGIWPWEIEPFREKLSQTFRCEQQGPPG